MSYVTSDAIFTENIRREKANERRAFASSASFSFHANPYNRSHRQTVTGKIFNRVRDADEDFDLAASDLDQPLDKPNEAFLTSVVTLSKPATARLEEPATSSQEIGWFTKTLPAVSEFRQDPRINFPIRETELSQYMAKVWKTCPTKTELMLLQAKAAAANASAAPIRNVPSSASMKKAAGKEK